MCQHCFCDEHADLLQLHHGTSTVFCCPLVMNMLTCYSYIMVQVQSSVVLLSYLQWLFEKDISSELLPGNKFWISNFWLTVILCHVTCGYIYGNEFNVTWGGWWCYDFFPIFLLPNFYSIFYLNDAKNQLSILQFSKRT